MFLAAGERQRKRGGREQRRALERIVRPVERRLSAAVVRWSAAGESGLDGAEKQFQSEARKALRSGFASAFDLVGAVMIAEVRAATPAIGKAAGGESDWEAIARWYLQVAAAKKIRRVSAGIKEALRRVLRRQLDETGGAEIATAAAVKKRVRQFARYRSARIARTEMHEAMQVASDAVAGETGMKIKQWSAALQPGRTRPTHAAANGQTVGIKEMFIVGGVRMRHPGAADAPAREKINCRCSTLYR